ncbi:MAG: M3 family oligoendopeptidase [Chitinophagaceae bacterium]
MMQASADIEALPRTFLPKDFVVSNWEALETYFQQLLDRPLRSKADLEKWLKDSSELESILSEDACWRQIKMTCDTENKSLEEAFVFFVTQIQPQIQPYADKINRKLIECPYTAELDQKLYFTYLRGVKKNIELFREINIPIIAELSVMGQQFGVISAKMTIEVEGKEYTLQQAAKFLESHDRQLRETVYRKINERRVADKDALNELYSQLVEKRQLVAANADFSNYRDYKFSDLGRFDYNKEDCFQFHDSVKKYILPLADKIYEAKKKKLGVDTLRPWDLEAEPEGTAPLRPFKTSDELLQKSIACFEKIRPFFAACLRKMNEMHRFDLESRKGKAPGGYNCPLAETGAPFIFMNAAGQMSDVTTMVHEGGHAVHSFLTHPLPLSSFKEYPMEIAEVASMAMELFSMDYWDVYFDSKDELKRAKEHQLERVITIFPWIATIDKFQHWVYENPNHSLEQRSVRWTEILNEFSSKVIDFSGLEDYRGNSWQRQLHLFEVPFYYIEYGIAQLGAIGLWKQFKQNKEAALDNYSKALSLGATATLPRLYEAAGLQFNFSGDNINELMQFVDNEMKKLAEL